MSAIASLRGSIRTKLLLLVTFVALVVGGVATIYGYASGQGVLQSELRKRGRYIASTLAYNARYGVLTEDKPFLNELLAGVVQASDEKQWDIGGAMIRDGKGAILAQRGSSVRDLPSQPATAAVELDSATDKGEEVILFRAPVMAGGEAVASGGDAGRQEQKGGVE